MGTTTLDREDGFSVVTVTKRLEFIQDIINNYERQAFFKKELIIIINNDQMSIDDFKAYKERKDIHIYQLSQKITLGECFSYGCLQTTYKYLAKFDDDDYYGEYYLQEAYDTFKSLNCNVVCKFGIFYYLQATHELIVRFYYRTEVKKARSGAGCTLCFTWETFEKVPFSPLSRGIDVDFLIRCNQEKLQIYSSTSFNFCSIRYANAHGHTWSISDEELKEKADKTFESKVMSFEEVCKYIKRYPV